MKKNDFKNQAYDVLIPVLQDLEHRGIPISNGHKLAELLTDKLWDALKDQV